MGKSNQRGIVYLAFGYEYLMMALHSAKTASETNPDLVLELISNVRFDPEHSEMGRLFERVTFVDHKAEDNRLIKTNIVRYTDLEYGAYIDCDTEVRGSLDPVFDCLEKWDLALRMSVKPTAKQYDVAPGLPSHLFSEWNGGVVFFRNNEASRKLFDTWTELFRSEGKNRDQPSLACALYGWSGRLLSLNAIWNTLRSDIKLFQRGLDDSRIWHYRKAENWPAVAPSILRLHRQFEDEVAEHNENLIEEIGEVERRYRFLSSRMYRLACCHPRIQRAVMKSVLFLMNAKMMPRFKLEREDRVSGSCYPEVGSNALP